MAVGSSAGVGAHSKGRFAGIVDSGPGRAISGVHRECTCFEIGNCGGLSRHGCMACVSEIRATATQGHGSRSVARGVGVAIATAAPTFERHARPEEHTSELQSLMRISYAVFCLTNNKT